MNANEIMSFETLWQKLWAIIYEIINFFKKNGKDEIDVGTNPVKIDSITNVY